MTTSIVLNLIDALNDRLTSALVGANVYDVTGNTDDPGNYLMIGVEDPDVDGFADSVESRQVWSGVGTSKVRYEDGTVSCCALAWNGDGDARAARAAVKAIIAAVENHLRTDPNLGGTVPGLNWVEFGERQIVKQAQGDTGAAVLSFFQLAFKARLT